ncbi:MAG: hypothetical protein RJA19_1881 [Bacteroidota bacterium]|jgi:hypothetical protein
MNEGAALPFAALTAWKTPTVPIHFSFRRDFLPIERQQLSAEREKLHEKNIRDIHFPVLNGLDLSHHNA